MKKLTALLLIVLLILSGCSQNDTVSDALRNEIREAYKQQFDSPNFANDDDDTIAGMQYYGTYNGYTVLFSSGMLCVVSEFQIGSYAFKWGSSCSLYAYKDGEFHNLSQVYEDGDLTDDHIEEIAVTHKAYFSQHHNWDYDINEQ